MPIKVAIFEDNKLIREALTAMLESTNGFECIGTYSDGNRWYWDIDRIKPDVVLMDIEMPGLNGIELTQLINEKYPEIKIIIQTVFEDSDKIFKALCAGALGYILKNDSPIKYFEAITDVYEGKASIDKSIAKKMINFFTNKNIILAEPTTTTTILSNRESEILKHLASGISLKEIASSLFISYETIRTHTKHIYKKLQVANRTEAMLKATQQGLL